MQQLRVAIYVRVSTDAQEREGTSLDTQERACREHAAAQGWMVTEVAQDTASGFTLDRPGLRLLRALVRSGGADVLLAHALDRLSRKQTHVAILVDEMERHGVGLRFVTEEFEDSAVGQFIRSAKAFVAEVEREKIVERTTRGKVERARSGKLPQGTGRGMYGYIYDRNSGRRLIHREQADIVRRTFQDFAAGESISGITNSLNAEGVASFMGGRWHPWTIRNVLSNPGYAGKTLYRRTRSTSQHDPATGKNRMRREQRDRREWIEIHGATPAIISQELFDAVSERLSDPERRRRARRKYDYPLSSRVRCGLCGSAMVGQTSLKRYHYYRCRRAYAGPRDDRCPGRYVRARALESAVVAEVVRVLAEPEIVRAELRRLADGALDLEAAAAAQTSLGTLERQRQRVLRLFQLGEIDETYLQRELDSIRQRWRSIEENARRVASSPSLALPDDPVAFQEVCDAVRSWVEGEAEAGRLREIADALQLTVRVQRDANGVSGVLEGLIPSEISHHCTNIGMTTWT